MMVKVKNIAGTGSNARNISESWLDYWEGKKGKTAQRCYAYDEDSARDKGYVYRCQETANLLGGHVKKVDCDDNRWYILPICTHHNHIDSEYWADEEDLVLEK